MIKKSQLNITFKYILINACLAILASIFTFHVSAETYTVWGTTTGTGTGTTGSGTSYDCSGNAGGFGTVSRDLWSVDSTTGASTSLASFDTAGCAGLTDSGVNFSSGSYLDKNTGNFYALQTNNTFKVYSGKDGSLVETTAAPTLTNVSLLGLSHTGVGKIVGNDGKKLLEKKADGSMHIGENSLVTIETGGQQLLYATNAAGSQIDINIKSGTNLLIGGTNVLTSINKNTSGISNLNKTMRKQDARSVALSAALTSLPTQGGDGSHTCGVGSGVRGSYSAMAIGCAADLSSFGFSDKLPRFLQNASLNAGTSFLTHDDPDYTFKAGMSFSFGKSQSKVRTSGQGVEMNRRLAVVEQKSQRISNRHAEAIKKVQRNNLRLLAKVNTLSHAKDELLALRAEVNELKSDKAEMLLMKEQLAQLTALLAGSDLVAAK